MKETIERIQNWYKLNCDGDWEHSYGFSIYTLDNPGWTIRIDLAETCLENLDFKMDFQNKNNENDWYQIKTKEKVLDIACGPENLKQVFEIFLDEIIPNYSNKEINYEIYLPLQGHHYDIWFPAKANILDEETVILTEIPEIDYKEIKVKEIGKIDFNQSDLEKLEMKFKVGDEVKVTLEKTDTGLLLTTKNKK